MEFKNYTLAQLEKFIKSGEYLTDEVVPITPLRVFSQNKNPKAKSDDVVLTIAYSDENKIVGFIGALPDQVQNIRCAWNSCWWVKPNAPAEVSMKLLFTFISRWDKKVMFSEMTPLSSSIIEKLGFCKHITTLGFRGYSRFNMAIVLPRKKTSFLKLKGLFKIADSILNKLLCFRNIFIAKSFRAVLDVETIHELSSIDDDFIAKFNRYNPSKRLSNDFNWIQQNSWLTAENLTNKMQEKDYPFSHTVFSFESKWVRFYKEGDLVALVNYTIKNDELKLPYVYCESVWLSEISRFFIDLLRNESRLSTITTFHNGIAKFLFVSKGFIYKTSLPKYSALSDTLLSEAGLIEPKLQMGDGDCVFT